MTEPHPAPLQEAPGAAVGASQGSGGAGLPPQGSEAPQEAVQGIARHSAAELRPRTEEVRPDPRRLAYDAALACLAANTDVPRDLVSRNAVAWLAIHAAVDAILDGRTTPDNAATRGETVVKRANATQPPPTQ